MRRIATALTLVLLSSLQPALAWDSTGHRLSASVALEFISEATRDSLLEILMAHPRYQQDFVAAMPADLTEAEQSAWLLGQAAFWPDIARGLPDAEQARFDRPTWHYIDGAWIRDGALLQGNVYVGIEAFANVAGPARAAIDTEAEADNVVTALDYNTRLLANPTTDPASRAVALCWVLHLVGDIHQPLHAGSLYSQHLFSDGDLGGNLIPIAENSNLHREWDRALRGADFATTVPRLTRLVSGFGQPRIQAVPSEWTDWLAESRQLLTDSAYTPAIRAAVEQAETEGRELTELTLDAGYRSQMEQIAGLRMALAGLRLAIWFENELP